MISLGTSVTAIDYNSKMRVGKTESGWQVAGQDYYCEFETFAEAISEAQAVFDKDWAGEADDYEWYRFFREV